MKNCRRAVVFPLSLVRKQAVVRFLKIMVPEGVPHWFSENNGAPAPTRSGRALVERFGDRLQRRPFDPEEPILAVFDDRRGRRASPTLDRSKGHHRSTNGKRDGPCARGTGNSMMAAVRAADHIISLSDAVSMEFQRIPAGEFRMGSRGEHPDEEPAHTVRITRPFYLGRYPATQAQFEVWSREAGVDHKNHFSNRADHPAESLTWDEAVAFCAWLNATRAGELPAGHVACLPTDAEWEHACRAGTDTEYYTGDGEAALREAGWFGADFETGSTHPVGLKRANGFGLYDMHGNVWEWCWDAYDADAYKMRVDGVVDPGTDERRLAFEAGALAAAAGGRNPGRVFRGGSWGNVARVCRSACRGWIVPGIRYRVRGFRVCVVPGPVTGRTSGPGAEPAAGDGARRDAGAESEGAGGAGVGPDLGRARFPRRSGGERA